MAVTRDGALLVSDDANGTIFRIMRRWRRGAAAREAGPDGSEGALLIADVAGVRAMPSVGGVSSRSALPGGVSHKPYQDAWKFRSSVNRESGPSSPNVLATAFAWNSSRFSST